MFHDLPPGPLVSTAWLADHLDDSQIRIVDMRGRILPPDAPRPHYIARHEDYLAGHIPHAVFIDGPHDLLDRNSPPPGKLAPPEQVAELFGQLGIGDQTLVIAYDDDFLRFAGRLQWVLRYYGHEAVRVLDGGLVKWCAEQRPLTTEIPAPTPAIFTPRPQPALRRTADQVLSALEDRSMVLIDARKPGEYTGKVLRAARGGHIPGALNLFFQDLVSGPNHTLAATDALRERFTAASIDVDTLSGRDVVTYCNNGVSSTPIAMALEILTGQHTAIYDGSWSEWGNDPQKPLA